MDTDHPPGGPGTGPRAALDARAFVTVLTAGPGHGPFLTVTSRHAGVGDNIYAGAR